MNSHIRQAVTSSFFVSSFCSLASGFLAFFPLGYVWVGVLCWCLFSLYLLLVSSRVYYLDINPDQPLLCCQTVYVLPCTPPWGSRWQMIENCIILFHVTSHFESTQLWRHSSRSFVQRENKCHFVMKTMQELNGSMLYVHEGCNYGWISEIKNQIWR